MTATRLVVSSAAALLLCGIACERKPGRDAPAIDPAKDPVGTATPPAVIVSSNGEGRAYTVGHGPCRITWVLHEDGINRGVVMHRPSCDRPLDEQAPLVGRILDAIGANPTLSESMRTLHWGRLLRDGPTDTTASLRVARAASRSMEWDRRTGRPRRGDNNGFVCSLLKGSGAFLELQEVFAVRGLSLTVASVEKVLVSPAHELSFFAEFHGDAVRADDRLPWDAQVWFSIRRASTPREER